MRMQQVLMVLAVASGVPTSRAASQSRVGEIPRAMGAATVNTEPRTVEPVSATSISGFSGGEITWLSMGAGEFGIDAISWWEVSDKPCALTVRSKSLSTGSAPGSSQRMNICGRGFILPANPYINGAANDADAKAVVFDGNPRHYLRGIAACTNNDNNHRVKGIRIFPASVALDGTVNALSSNESENRPNCSIWRQAVFCPNGQIASGVEVRHTDEEITGLGLRCRRVTMQAAAP